MSDYQLSVETPDGQFLRIDKGVPAESLSWRSKTLDEILADVEGVMITILGAERLAAEQRLRDALDAPLPLPFHTIERLK